LAAGSNLNLAAAPYVAWTWRLGPAAGFAITAYAGDGQSGRTIAHDLGVVPSLIIIKRRDSAASSSWAVYHAHLGVGDPSRLSLNLQDGARPPPWGPAAPTATTFSLGDGADVNENNATYVAYLWANVPGFSRMTSYVGNGSLNGPFVHLGFRPRFVLVKRDFDARAWLAFDAERSPTNPVDDYLQIDTGGEHVDTAIAVDFLANGIKLRTINDNANVGRCVVIAFAETPQDFATGR
jgi:hypothetical protein